MSRPKKLSAEEVAQNLAALRGWQLVDEASAIEQAFRFKNFATAWTFMCRIAAEAERIDHHPEWSNVYNRVSIKLTTHDADGLTELDFQLAEKIDQFQSEAS